jgi:glycosidase
MPPGFGFTTGTPWLPIPAAWRDISVAAQAEDETSTLALYRAALAARRASSALRDGSFAWSESPRGSLVSAREARTTSLPAPSTSTLKPSSCPTGNCCSRATRA